MRFNAEAYNKLFPRPTEEPAEVRESAIETFKATKPDEKETATEVTEEVEEDGSVNACESVCE